MFKFVLMTGLILGSLAGMSGAVQAVDSAAEPFHPAQVSAEKGQGEQSLGSAMAMATVFRVGDAVWFYSQNRDFLPGVILAVRVNTYQVRLYFGTGQTEVVEVSPDRLSPR